LGGKKKGISARRQIIAKFGDSATRSPTTIERSAQRKKKALCPRGLKKKERVGNFTLDDETEGLKEGFSKKQKRRERDSRR